MLDRYLNIPLFKICKTQVLSCVLLVFSLGILTSCATTENVDSGAGSMEVDVGTPFDSSSSVRFINPCPKQDLVFKRMAPELGEWVFSRGSDSRWIDMYNSSNGKYHIVISGFFDKDDGPVVRNIRRADGPLDW